MEVGLPHRREFNRQYAVWGSHGELTTKVPGALLETFRKQKGELMPETLSAIGEERDVIIDGANTLLALDVLAGSIPSEALDSIRAKAAEIIRNSVDPIAGRPAQRRDGLLYGLIQSGKTSIITIAAAMAADNGFRCIVILTSDINLLYDQTLSRIQQALRSIKVLGKDDWGDRKSFERRLRSEPFVMVCSKNSGHLNALLDALRVAGASGLPAFIVDDEADQASLNTFANKNARKRTEDLSAINRAISDLRSFFEVNTYLQVTATPQSLILQSPEHAYHPLFYVLSERWPRVCWW